MGLDNNNDLLREQLGKGTVEIFTTVAQTSKNYYAVYFPVTSVVSSITVADATGESALVTTLPAGTTLFMNVTSIQLTSGIGIGYDEGLKE
ncbi:MAG: hypothetical protein Unbinned4026contig1003_29 [Prokaryotic dsDNA virus sp.]|nr:MAG: hypothetical protein Unbinned4026contig1003_29 [Prokaryotic dsDNA virus sp.]|tara:strand:- start:9966 stop:10238 length:273 start_codon:yes stop_codon:yes gene_type:complete